MLLIVTVPSQIENNSSNGQCTQVVRENSPLTKEHSTNEKVEISCTAKFKCCKPTCRLCVKNDFMNPEKDAQFR